MKHGKLFDQIFDNAVGYQVRWVYRDLIKLADAAGLVAMTQGEIAHRTKVPLDIVKDSFSILASFDPQRSGRRIEKETGGWRILAYMN